MAIVSVRWTQDRRQRGRGQTAAGEEAEEVEIGEEQTAKGINECGF